MISNYVLRTKIDALKKEKRALVERKTELEVLFRECGLSKNQAYKLNKTGISTKSNETIVKRSTLGKKLVELEKKFVSVNNELRKCYSEEEAEKNVKLMEVFRDIFTQDQMIEIKQEAERRIRGESGFKFSFSVKDAEQAILDSKRYRSIAREQLEKMIEFRILLTGLIEQGCAKFGDGEFLKFISPLNRLIIPLAELEKIKRKENL